MRKILIVIDMQNDFIDAALGTKEAVAIVDASCCACVTPEKHQAALETMRSCQIQIVNG